mmetsp:Transcript_14805/g.30705  ORF Transcript_14805/g.30705 Transcript_14805/m.30705 type:complete len:187 (-) Transcript_14805:241-801(-)|eukprot:CAMPEP_0168167784 /NCGR_PEP_ID=MMETSP0139_2-20121125/2722_1 /TAXON_ID=44445 /ORGANISM="Pseudo-nitzschia australis, Strain 10249 10 AB" /LENGTH=186 /DNA_ID=CAMNT_0008085025 /DNA_START=93 /DNA_END=653 /DNA_ORIENTATION=+
MAITKKTQKQNNMLFLLASLACNGQSDSQSCSINNGGDDLITPAAVVSDASDDDNTIAASPPVKEIVVSRRRRRPIKKRIPYGDYRSSSLSSGTMTSPTKSLLELSIDIFRCSRKASTPDQVESRFNKTVSARLRRNKKNCTREVSKGDNELWKQIHSPLVLPSFLPGPAESLRSVKSICLTLEER